MAGSTTPVRNQGSRADTWTIIVQLGSGAGGMTNLGVWDKKTGGDLDSDEVKYYPGGMAAVEALGGRLNPTNLTLQRIYDRVDDAQYITKLFNGVGNEPVTVTQHAMNLDGTLYGAKRVIWTGVLKRVRYPDVDSETTGAALIEIEVTVNASPTFA